VTDLGYHRPDAVDQASSDHVHPEVDVVILSWNRTVEIDRAVESVLSQRGARPEVWIVDQGSSAETLAFLDVLAARSPHVHVVRLDRNVGVPAGRNIGIAAGAAAVVVGLDNDAVLASPDALRRCADAFAADPDLGALAFRILDSKGGRDELSWVHPRSRSADHAFPAARFCGCASALRRSAFEACGGYDDSLFFYWEEMDLCRRLLETGYRIEYRPSLTVVHTPSPDARLGWRTGRYYYCVRNRLYLEHRFGARPAWLAALAFGYVVRGCHNGVGLAAVRGIAGAVVLAARCRRSRPRIRLSPATRAYLREHEGVHGSSARRLLKAAVRPLPRDRSQ
jgi:GT2 family glycosyltransferase